jgi:DNA ligase D-like protein (predicted ligase)
MTQKKSMSEIKKMLENEKGAQKKAISKTIDPMLATLTHSYFYKSDWIYERKFDGERCFAIKKGKKVTLKSRNNKSLNISYPEIQKAIEKLTDIESVIFDGEVVAFQGDVTSFSKLQPRMHILNLEPSKKKIKVYYYIFDILYIDGYDITHLPLLKRKHILEKLFYFKNPLRLTSYQFKTEPAYFKDACKKGWEGLIVKDIHSKYESKRSPAWLKFKCAAGQELVIGGFTDPQGSRTGLGALLLGYFQDDTFMYAGKVGTGFDTETLKDLRQKLNKLIIKKCPFSNYDDSEDDVHWVKPKLVCEVTFENWTKGNKLRHSRYLGLRNDKSAKDVVKEEAKSVVRKSKK